MREAITSWNTPIYNAIKEYASTEPVVFHMPGHKLGKGIPAEFIREIEKLDLTEIPGTDNLHAPTGAIREAQELAAAAFGARKSFFLVNGSTVGLHAAIAAICTPGQRLIVGRDCHRSVINGMLLAGVRPYYILPEYSEEFGISTGVTVSSVKKALDDAPDAAGVLITRPNYYGVCSDVKSIAKVVHMRGRILAVDEAHGSHLTFNAGLPVCALEAGADICVQSAHKTLPAFTQGAYLHIGSETIDQDRLKYFLDIYQTTSPSYIIMAFLDIAREIMQKNADALLSGLLRAIEDLSGGMDDSGVRLHGNNLKGFTRDKTRIVANTAGLGITGYQAEKLLREKFNIQVEMSDMYNTVSIVTIADDYESLSRLFSGLSGLSRYACSEELPILKGFSGIKIPFQEMDPGRILNGHTERVLLKNAAGRVSMGIISPYPPGTALVCPGETFTGEIIDLLHFIMRNGGIIHGIDENNTVSVAV